MGENPTVTETEFYVTPFDWFVYNDVDASVVSELEASDVIGIASWVWETDEGFDIGLYFLPNIPAEDILDVGNVEFYGDAILLGVGESVNSTVEENTWGRIKASFGVGSP